MKTTDAVNYYGSKTRVAAALGISRGAVSQWGENVPEMQALKLERLTNGALSVDSSHPKPTPAAQVTTAALAG